MHFSRLNLKYSSVAYFLAFFPPPNRIPAPNTNPKSYHPPVLLTSYMETLSINKLRIKVKGAMIPCIKPYQKPLGSASTHASMATGSAQLEINMTRIRARIASRFFLNMAISFSFNLKDINHPCCDISHT